LSVGAAAADAQVLHRLQIEIHSGKLRQLAAQPADDPVGTDAPLIQRLESDEHIPGIQCSAETAAIECHHRIDRGIAFHCARQGHHAAAHGLERRVLIGDDGARDAPRVLLREEALGDDDI